MITNLNLFSNEINLLFFLIGDNNLKTKEMSVQAFASLFFLFTHDFTSIHGNFVHYTILLTIILLVLHPLMVACIVFYFAVPT